VVVMVAVAVAVFMVVAPGLDEWMGR